MPVAIFKHAYIDFQPDTKSFTQMIWAGTQMVGFGRAKAADGRWYGCAHYYPEGNVTGFFNYNVRPVNAYY